MLILLLLCQIVFGCVSSIPIGGASEDGRFGSTFGQNFVKSSDNEMLQKSIEQPREDERLNVRSSRDVKESNTVRHVKVQEDAGKSNTVSHVKVQEDDGKSNTVSHVKVQEDAGKSNTVSHVKVQEDDGKSNTVSHVKVQEDDGKSNTVSHVKVQEDDGKSNTVSHVKVQEDAGKSAHVTLRCGRPDKKLSDVDSRRVAFDSQYELSNAPLSYSLSGRRWWKITVTWKIVNLSRKLTESEQTLALESALAQWAEHIPLKFRHAPNQEADMNILFSRGEHGDPWVFDGQGQVLAHAFPPGRGIGGDVHFDDDEAWTIGTGQGTDLLTVALHEFGHAIGLEHSDDHSSIMTPQYIYREGPKLSDADVAGIKAVYYRPDGVRAMLSDRYLNQSCEDSTVV